MQQYKLDLRPNWISIDPFDCFQIAPLSLNTFLQFHSTEVKCFYFSFVQLMKSNPVLMAFQISMYCLVGADDNQLFRDFHWQSVVGEAGRTNTFFCSHCGWN